MLLHLGAGWFHENFDDHSAATINYDASAAQTCTNTSSFGGLLDKTCTGGLGLTGARIVRQFPYFQVGGAGPVLPFTTAPSASAGTGGMNSLGPFTQGPSGERRPSGVANLTWVRGSHNYKIGGEWRGERYPSTAYSSTTGNYNFNAANGPNGGFTNATSQTALDGQPAPSSGVYGFPLAAFVLGDVANFTIAQPGSVTVGKQQWGLFLQDTWKVTRKLTLDYGLRWDYATYGHESNGMVANFSPTTPNPSAGNHPGAQIFEQTCNCHFATNYPYAIGPRFGFAYQINSKTVFRGGIGVVYNSTAPIIGGAGANSDTTSTPSYGQWVGQLAGGIPTTLHPQFPNLNPNAGQGVGAIVAAPGFLDPNSDRPARQYQWSASIQREISRNLVVEASYVGNRGVWWPANGFGTALSSMNVLSVADLTKYGFTVGNTTDSALLTSLVGSLTPDQKSQLAARGVNLPYANFPANQTVRQSLLPYPQYTGSISPTNAPLGKTWYDALQIVVTKRLSHGITFNANYSHSKNLDLFNTPDLFNRGLGKNLSANDLPNQLRISAEYRMPNYASSRMRVLSTRPFPTPCEIGPSARIWNIRVPRYLAVQFRPAPAFRSRTTWAVGLCPRN